MKYECHIFNIESNVCYNLLADQSLSGTGAWTEEHSGKLSWEQQFSVSRTHPFPRGGSSSQPRNQHNHEILQKTTCFTFQSPPSEKIRLYLYISYQLPIQANERHHG